MNTNTLKRFAKEARIKLLDQVGRKLEYVLTQKSAVLLGKDDEIAQLKSKVQQVGKAQVVEMVAYTWFNRLMALRFMDANGYTLPKVVSPANENTGNSTPEILQEAKAGNIDDGLQVDRQHILDLLGGRKAVADAHTEAYKILLVAACNQWHAAMPFMFERISDYTELLLPDDLLSERSIVSDVRNGMSEEDCQHEEILGWLYQFYISDENERLIKSKNVYQKHELAPASQLFTPKWIVRYMVDNTLGQIWSEINPETKILGKLEFYIKPAYLDQLQPRAKKKVEDIKFFEPCVGSAHILSYAFDVFYLIYEEQGYNPSDIAELILKNNLFGVDIDERAAQIASFVLMMKGRRKNSRFLKKGIVPNISFYQNFEDDPKFDNATALGSLISVEPSEVQKVKVDRGSVFEERQTKLKTLYSLLGQRYDCVVTNPPYISSSRMEGTLKQFVETKYPETKSDLFATFILRCLELCNADGLTGYMTPFVWMFISRYDKLRENIIDNHFINNLIQLEYSGFDGATVPVCTFTLRNKSLKTAKGSYIRLSDFKGSENQAPRTLEAIRNNQCGWFFTSDQEDFEKIPDCPIGYWLNSNVIKLFSSAKSIGEMSKTRKGMATGLNAKFVRNWREVSFSKIGFSLSRTQAKGSNLKWFPYANGGNFRKWYGNYDDVVNWKNDGFELQTERNDEGRIRAVNLNLEFIFNEGASWTSITSGFFSIRYLPKGFLFSSASNALFNKDLLSYLIGLLNCKLSSYLLKVFSPTLNANPGDIGKILVPAERQEETITAQTNKIIELSRIDWDSREASWDFQQNELIRQRNPKLEDSLSGYNGYWTEKFYELHRNEEELNRRFIEIYGLENELTPDIPFEEITILQEESKIFDGELFIDPEPVLLQLVSYSMGCIFGRYSLDKTGLILAIQGETLQDFLQKVPNPTFLPDDDNIIPVLDGEWFTDDIVGRFKEFLKVAFSAEHFEENLKYIEDTIGKDIRKYFVKDFYNDHIKRYKKRPIYWMFSSPKGHFKALIYMHRYQPDLCSKLLNDYLQAFISKLEAAKQTQNMLSLREDITPREKNAAIKDMDKLELMLKDCREYEKTLFKIATQKISIDLDDGVKVNYQKFKDVLIPIKGLEKDEE